MRQQDIPKHSLTFFRGTMRFSWLCSEWHRECAATEEKSTLEQEISKDVVELRGKVIQEYLLRSIPEIDEKRERLSR